MKSYDEQLYNSLVKIKEYEYYYNINRGDFEDLGLTFSISLEEDGEVYY